MQVESSAKLLLTIDEIKEIRVFRLTYAAVFDKFIQEEKVKQCHGCAIQHPSQRQHSCLMMDNGRHVVLLS